MNIFSILKKNPIKKLDKLYESKIEKTMHTQRKGDIKSYAVTTTLAEALKYKF